MKKQWKILTTSIVCCIPVALIIVFCLPLSNKTQISCVGSSGVKPFIESLAKDYSKQNSKYDVTVDAGGSGYGISQVAYGYASIGNASKNPFSAVKEQYKDDWTNNHIKTITVGWEAICLVYIPPIGLSPQDLNLVLSLSSANISYLYQAFSGYKDGLNTDKPYLGHFINEQDASLTEEDKNLLNNTQLIPYARSGGSTTSGTAASFYDSSHYSDAHDNLNDDQKNAFLSGTYGKDFKLYDTDEANSRAWDYFSRNNVPGSVVYLSSGFVSQNMDLIQKDGYGIFAYQPEGSTAVNEFSVSGIKNGYNFYRPLNVMCSIDNDKAWDFVDYLVNQSSDDQWEKLGAKKISDDDKATMVSKVDPTGVGLRIDDNDLMGPNERNQSWDSDDVVFGVTE